MRTNVMLEHASVGLAAAGLAALLVSCSTSSPAPRQAGAATATPATPATTTQPLTVKPEPLAPGWTAGSAIVKAIGGGTEAHYWGNDARWHPLRLGQVLHEGDKVRTGKQVICDLTLRENGPTMRLVPETTLTFERLRFRRTDGQVVPETVVALDAGRILGSVGALPAGSLYLVKTPTGTSRVFSETKYELREDLGTPSGQRPKEKLP